MTLIAPDLLHLIGAGFRDDDYAADGHHLRWSFDPRLGFPRTAFCIDRRRSVHDPKSREALRPYRDTYVHAVRMRTHVAASGPVSATTQREIVAEHSTITRAGGFVTRSQLGVELSADPLTVDLRGGTNPPDGPASYVRLIIQVVSRSGSVTATGVRDDRGTAQPVARATAPRPVKLAAEFERALEEEPLRVALEPPRLGREDAALYRELLAIDPERYRYASAAWIRRVAGRLREAGAHPRVERHIDPVVRRPFDVKVDRREREESSEPVAEEQHLEQLEIVLTAPQIHTVEITGRDAHLAAAEWVTERALDDAEDWRPVGCFPASTDEEDYVRRNEELIAGRSPKELVHGLLFGSGRPRGVEPLDDPEVPPTRHADDAELERRYIEPWLSQLEPWLRAVLEGSAGGARHQSEITETVDLDVLGQDINGGVDPGAPADRTMELPLYAMLLGASFAFQVARQLGLATILEPPDDGPWDYRVRGTWEADDLRAWPDSLRRRLAALTDALAESSPAQVADLQAELVEVATELVTTEPIVDALIGAGGGGPVELGAVCLGVRQRSHPLFGAPSSISIAEDGLAPPIPGQPVRGVARISWPLRPRAHGLDDAGIPVGATLARADAATSGRFTDVLNPVSPDTGVAQAILTLDDPSSPGGGGTTQLRDETVPPGRDLRYGVSEADPFSRWSLFTEGTHRWDHHPPPDVPNVEADLDVSGAAYSLEVRFAWPTGDPDIDAMTFRIHLRRAPLPAGADPHAPIHWGSAERIAGSGAGPVGLQGDGTGPSMHDGMTVQVATTDDASERRFTVTLDGLSLARDVLGSARVYVGIATEDADGIASEDVGGPALARHILETQPPSPGMPPDPLPATYADAMDRSSITLEWQGHADTRYTLMRAGEREIVHWCENNASTAAAAALSSYDPDASAAVRAAALKDLAVHARDAFQPRGGPVPAVPQVGTPPRDPPPEDWPPIPASKIQVTDTLPGKLRTLTVYTSLGRSRAGTPASWPSSGAAFAVVRVPHVPEPSVPTVLRGVWRPPDAASAVPEEGIARVELTIARPPPGTAEPVAYEVYRSADPDLVDDHRRMRPLHGLVVHSGDWTPVEIGGASVDVVSWVDPTVAPWRTYHYRVVARAAAVTGSGPGTRSGSCQPVRVETIAAGDPAPATDIQVTRGAADVQVSFIAETVLTPLGDFRTELIDADREITLATSKAEDVRTGEDSYVMVVDDVPAGTTVTVRLVDPLGRASVSMGGPVP